MISTITLANKDNIASGDYVWLRVSRAAATLEDDNVSGDVELYSVVVYEE